MYNPVNRPCSCMDTPANRPYGCMQEVQTQTRWLAYNFFLTKVEDLIEQETAPLCWIKYPNGELQKFFIVWW